MSFLRERLVELRARRPNHLFRTETGDGRFYWRLTPPPPEPDGNHDDGCPASTDNLPHDAVRRETVPAVQPTAGHKRQLQDDLQKMADQLQNCELAREDDADVQAPAEPAKKQKQSFDIDLSDIAEKLQKCDVQTSSCNEDSQIEHIASASSTRRSKERGPYRRRQRKARSESSTRVDRPLDEKIASAPKADGHSVVVASRATSPPASEANDFPTPRPDFPRCSRTTNIKDRLFRPLPGFGHHRPGTDGDAARLCRRRQAKARAESCNRLVTPPTDATKSSSNVNRKPDAQVSSPPDPEDARRPPRPRSPDRSRVVNLQPLPRHDHGGTAKNEDSTRRRKATKKSLDFGELNKPRRPFIRRPKKIVYKRGKSTGFATNVEPEFVVFEGRRDVPDFDEDFIYPSSDIDVEVVGDSDIDSYPCLASDEEDNLCNALRINYIHHALH